MRVVGHGVESARFPGHASKKPFRAEKYSDYDAELLDRLDHICRTARRVNANVGGKRRYALFVKVHKSQKQPPKSDDVYDNAFRLALRHDLSPARKKSDVSCSSSEEKSLPAADGLAATIA